MPRASVMTADLAAEIATRRRAGEAWKSIAADFRARGLPSARSALWEAMQGRRDVREHICACAARQDRATPDA